MSTTCEVRRGRLLGLPCVLGGRDVGRVERCLLAQDGHRLTGLLLRRGLSPARFVPAENVALVGDVSVILRSAPLRTRREADFPLSTVKDSTGLTLGYVTDLWIRPDSLNVTAIEITLGPIDEWRHGRRRVDTWTVNHAREVLVPADTLTMP